MSDEISFIPGNDGYEESMYDDSINIKRTLGDVGSLLKENEVENGEGNILSRKVRFNSLVTIQEYELDDTYYSELDDTVLISDESDDVSMHMPLQLHHSSAEQVVPERYDKYHLFKDSIEMHDTCTRGDELLREIFELETSYKTFEEGLHKRVHENAQVPDTIKSESSPKKLKLVDEGCEFHNIHLLPKALVDIYDYESVSQGILEDVFNFVFYHSVSYALKKFYECPINPPIRTISMETASCKTPTTHKVLPSFLKLFRPREGPNSTKQTKVMDLHNPNTDDHIDVAVNTQKTDEIPSDEVELKTFEDGQNSDVAVEKQSHSFEMICSTLTNRCNAEEATTISKIIIDPKKDYASLQDYATGSTNLDIGCSVKRSGCAHSVSEFDKNINQVEVPYHKGSKCFDKGTSMDTGTVRHQPGKVEMLISDISSSPCLFSQNSSSSGIPIDNMLSELVATQSRSHDTLSQDRLMETSSNGARFLHSKIAKESTCSTNISIAGVSDLIKYLVPEVPDGDYGNDNNDVGLRQSLLPRKIVPLDTDVDWILHKKVFPERLLFSKSVICKKAPFNFDFASINVEKYEEERRRSSNKLNITPEPVGANYVKMSSVKRPIEEILSDLAATQERTSSVDVILDELQASQARCCFSDSSISDSVFTERYLHRNHHPEQSPVSTSVFSKQSHRHSGSFDTPIRQLKFDSMSSVCSSSDLSCEQVVPDVSDTEESLNQKTTTTTVMHPTINGHNDIPFSHELFINRYLEVRTPPKLRIGLSKRSKKRKQLHPYSRDRTPTS